MAESFSSAASTTSSSCSRAQRTTTSSDVRLAPTRTKATVVETLPLIVAVLRGACDGSWGLETLQKNHGKAIVALDEMIVRVRGRAA